MNIYDKVAIERGQTPAGRKQLFTKVSKFFANRAVVTFYTSFDHPVQMDDVDCDMLQSVLQHTPGVKNGLVLMVNSPGGDPLAAERIVNICRAYSGTGDYWALVPGRAKSAGTVVCMGAAKIIMAEASELGPIDPQVILEEDGARKWFSAFGLVNGYKALFNSAIGTSGRVEPFIQQLARYDARLIQQYEGFIDMSKDIAVKLLASGMMAGKSKADIEAKINMFLVPAAGTHVHGRAIYSKEAKDCDLSIENISVKSKEWQDIYELHYRTESYVTINAAKAVESATQAFYVPIPGGSS